MRCLSLALRDFCSLYSRLSYPLTKEIGSFLISSCLPERTIHYFKQFLWCIVLNLRIDVPSYFSIFASCKIREWLLPKTHSPITSTSTSSRWRPEYNSSISNRWGGGPLTVSISTPACWSVNASFCLAAFPLFAESPTCGVQTHLLTICIQNPSSLI